MANNKLRNALKRAGFKVQTRQAPMGSDGRAKGSLWSIKGHGVEKSHLSEQEAAEILAAYRRGDYSK